MSVASLPAFAGKHFGCHVGRRAGNVLGRKILQSEHPHHPEIDQLERSTVLENDVVGLDVAMDDAGAVQRRGAARQLDRDIASFLQAQQRPARQSRLQKFALVERHDRVKAGLPPGRQFDDAADPGAMHARAHPGLAGERRTIVADRRIETAAEFECEAVDELVPSAVSSARSSARLAVRGGCLHRSRSRGSAIGFQMKLVGAGFPSHEEAGTVLAHGR